MNDEFNAPQDSDPNGGFGIVPRYLRGRLNAREIAVYVALTWRINTETHECWMRHKLLAEEAGMSLSSVQRTLKDLEAKGIVTWRPKYGPDGDVVCNIYRLHVGAPAGGVGQADRTPKSQRPDTPVPVTDRTRTQERDTMNESLVGQGYLSSDSADGALFDASSPDGDGHTDTTTSSNSAEPNGFAEFWETYGKKVGKADAIKAYRAALKKPGVNASLLIASARSYVEWMRSEGRFPTYTKNPASWLRGEHWTDERQKPISEPSRSQGWMDLAQSMNERYAQPGTACAAIGGQR